MIESTEKLSDAERLAALRKSIAEMRSRQNVLTVADVENVKEMEKTLAEITKRYFVDLESVRSVLGNRLLTVSDYQEFMPGLQADLQPEDHLPFNILAVLNRQSPVHSPGVLVKDSHLLAWVPDNISLNDLSQALGGQAGRLLWSDWFIKENDSLGALKLSDVGRSGHWALVPDRVPVGTESIGLDDSLATLLSAFGENYQQSDVISFTSALLLHAVKNGERWYSDTYAWCNDPRVGTSFEDDSCFCGFGSRALDVGYFSAHGLDVLRGVPDDVDFVLGCAAVWNFDNGSQKL